MLTEHPQINKMGQDALGSQVVLLLKGQDISELNHLKWLVKTVLVNFDCRRGWKLKGDYLY